MLDPAVSLALAEQVALAARKLGFDSALIGAAALAVYRYTRGTEDIDLAVSIEPWSQLRALEQALVSAGRHTLARMPGDDDPLGGGLGGWGSEGEGGEAEDVVEVVNFHNPARRVASPGAAAIARAEYLPGSPLRCVKIEDLVALKLYAGGLSDLADIVQLLARNPETNLEAVRVTALPFDAENRLETLIAQAAKLRSRYR